MGTKAPAGDQRDGMTYLPPPPMGPLPAHEIVEAEIVDETPAAQDDTQSQPRAEPRDGAQQGSTGDRTARKARTRAAGAAPSRGAQPPPPQDTSLPPLRAGMSVVVNVDTGHARGLPQFLAALFNRGQRGA